MLWDSFFLHKSSNLDTLLCVCRTGGVGKGMEVTRDFSRNCRKAKAMEYFIHRMWI